MQQTYNDNYVFHDLNGNKVLCHLTIYHSRKDKPVQTIVVATALAENPGQSITNCYKRLADMVTAAHRLEAAHTLWVEHYNSNSYDGKPLEPNEDDRYSLVQMSWDGQRFSQPRFAHLSESQLLGLLSRQEQPQTVELAQFNPKLLTLEGVNTVAEPYGLKVVNTKSGDYRHDPTLQLSGKEYVVVDADGTVLSSCKDLDSASMFLTLWSMTNEPVTLEPEAEAIALEQLNAIAKRKKLKVITSDTPGYQHHDWVVKYENRYAVLNQYGTVLTTAKDLETAETIVLLQADVSNEPLEL